MGHSVRKSWERYRKSLSYLGGGSSTNSKRPKLENAEPALIVRGKGCRVWDCDGNEYIDFRGGLGPVSLGYCIEEIDRAVTRQLGQGVIFGHPHPLEGEVAELLTEVVPCAERVRFLKTGGEAVAACIHIARGVTGRKKILHCGYNGWLSRPSRGRGYQPTGLRGSPSESGASVVQDALHVSLPWGDINVWRKTFEDEATDIAAVVLASDYAEMEKGREFLPALRQLTRNHDCLLVMDEIVTGFRLAIGGAHEYFSIDPDMAVFAKAMANGMPIAAYLGRADLIDLATSLRVSSTFGGETLSLAATQAVIGFYREHRVIDHIWEKGKMFSEGLQDLFERHGLQGLMRGAPPCPLIEFERDDLLESFLRCAYQSGVSLYTVPYVGYSHSEADIQEALGRLEQAIGLMQS